MNPRGRFLPAIVGLVFLQVSPAIAWAPQTSAMRPRLSSGAIAKQASPSIVTIVAGSSQGSGVIVDEAGVIVTNLHVVRGQPRTAVRLANGDIYDDVSVVDVDERKDLVLLKIKAFGLEAVPMANSDQVAVGDKVVLIGSPRGLDLTVTDGLISAVRDSGDGYRLFQTNAAASPGSSGGGMFNDLGELIGILSAKMTNGENINFAVPANYVRGLFSTQVRMTMTQLATRFPASASTAAASTPASGTPAQATAAASRAKLQALLEGGKFKYEKAGETAWTATFSGKHAQTLSVHMSVYETLAIVQGLVAKNVTLTSEQLNALLKRNFSVDLVKTSLTDEHNLIVLADAEVRLLDAQGLERIVNAVAASVDDVFGLLGRPAGSANRPALVGPPAGRLRSHAILQDHATLQYDSATWRPQDTREPTISQFGHVSDAVFARLIAERVEVPMEKLGDVALANARSVSPTTKETRRGWREVNGKRMLFLEFEATVNNTSITYYGHYYSDSSGTVQILGWTSTLLIDAYRDDIERLVSGFQVRK